MRGMTRAVFAGLTTLDIIQSVERVPSSNEKVAARDFLVVAGGPAANAAVACAHLGGRPTLTTALPEHALTEPIVRDLAKCGVELDIAAEYSGPPITASILVTHSTGDRAVISPTGTATAANPAPTHVPSLDGVGAVLIDGYFRAIAAPIAAAARERGIPVILDAGSVKHYTDEVVRMADIAIVSADFAPAGARTAPEDVFDYLAARGVHTSVITRGSHSILFRSPSTSGEVEVPTVRVVDTLGAGDFFHGAFTWRIASLGAADARLAEDLAFSAQVAGSSLGSFGTRAWLSAPPRGTS